MTFKYTIAFILFISCSFSAQSQVPEFDKLEMLFAQRHYKRVYRKANSLLDKPEFDYSMMPKYYKSISLLQLAQNDFWLKRHPSALDEAQQLFLEVKYSPNGESLFNAHYYELTWLRNDMVAWTSDLKRMGLADDFKRAQDLIAALFDGMPDVEIPGEISEIVESIENTSDLTLRENIVQEAQQHLGTPYVWAGNSASGFDCSGFTSFVMEKYGKTLPRRSADQFEQSQKVKAKNVQKGDLVFFNNGSGISHVGIVISEKGEPVKMIHSSSSKGIIVTDIEQSEYWMKRLHGYGTYVN